MPRSAGEPVRWVETDRRWVALTFDGAPSPVWTPVIMRLLRSYGVSATFFPTGVGLQRHASLVRTMVGEGYEVGAAPYSGGRMTGDAAQVQREVWAASVRLEAVTGVKALIFRPIDGGPTQALLHAASVNGERLVLWDIDGRDDTGIDAEAVATRILRGLRRGAIVRLHQGPTAARALGLILPQMRALGYRAVTVSELLGGGLAQSSAGQPQPPSRA